MAPYMSLALNLVNEGRAVDAEFIPRTGEITFQRRRSSRSCGLIVTHIRTGGPTLQAETFTVHMLCQRERDM